MTKPVTYLIEGSNPTRLHGLEPNGLRRLIHINRIDLIHEQWVEPYGLKLGHQMKTCHVPMLCPRDRFSCHVSNVPDPASSPATLACLADSAMLASQVVGHVSQSNHPFPRHLQGKFQTTDARAGEANPVAPCPWVTNYATTPFRRPVQPSLTAVLTLIESSAIGDPPGAGSVGKILVPFIV